LSPVIAVTTSATIKSVYQINLWLQEEFVTLFFVRFEPHIFFYIVRMISSIRLRTFMHASICFIVTSRNYSMSVFFWIYCGYITAINLSLSSSSDISENLSVCNSYKTIIVFGNFFMRNCLVMIKVMNENNYCFG